MPEKTALTTRRQSGQAAEEVAQAYLLAQGLVPVARNFSARTGEIDLIMKDRETLVFIEVRKRSRSHFAGAAESITYAKQRRLVKTARLFMQKQGKTPAGRFDVIAIDGDNITWLKNVIDEW